MTKLFRTIVFRVTDGRGRLWSRLFGAGPLRRVNDHNPSARAERPIPVRTPIGLCGVLVITGRALDRETQ